VTGRSIPARVAAEQVHFVSGCFVMVALAWRMRYGEDGSCANEGCFVVMVLRELVHERLHCCHGFLTDRR